jgi:hypothetical protein
MINIKFAVTMLFGVMIAATGCLAGDDPDPSEESEENVSSVPQEYIQCIEGCRSDNGCYENEFCKWPKEPCGGVCFKKVE